MNGINQPQTGMRLFDGEGRRLYFTEDERRAFMAAAAKAPREVRSFCGVLHSTGCRISEALALTPQQIDLSGRVVVFESLKKRKAGVFRAVPVPPELLDTLDLVHSIREAQRRGEDAKALLWPEQTKTPPGTHKQTKQELYAAARNPSDGMRSGLNSSVFSDTGRGTPQT